MSLEEKMSHEYGYNEIYRWTDENTWSQGDTYNNYRQDISNARQNEQYDTRPNERYIPNRNFKWSNNIGYVAFIDNWTNEKKW